MSVGDYKVHMYSVYLLTCIIVHALFKKGTGTSACTIIYILLASYPLTTQAFPCFSILGRPDQSSDVIGRNLRNAVTYLTHS